MIQIVAINAGTLLELLFLPALRPRVNAPGAVPTREKGGIRIAKAAFRAGKIGVLTSSRFTAR